MNLWPVAKRRRAARWHLHYWNRYWARFGKCWFCGFVTERMFFYGEQGRNICWDCAADHRERRP